MGLLVWKGRLGAVVPPPLRAGPSPWPAPHMETPAPPQAGNSASPLRERGPAHPLRAGSEFQRGGAETAGKEDAVVGQGSAVARAAPPCGGSARLRPCRGDAPRGRGMSQVSAGTPSTHCPAHTEGDLAATAAGLCSPGLCDLGQPRTLSGPKPRGQPGLAKALLSPGSQAPAWGAREAPWRRRGLARASRLPDQQRGQVGPAPPPTAL